MPCAVRCAGSEGGGLGWAGPGLASWEVGVLLGTESTVLSPRAQAQGPLLPQILTALDRDALCRKHRLRHKLEHIISLVSGDS